MKQQNFGSLIGAVFGLVYVLVNAGSLPLELSLPARLLGVIAFVLVLVAVGRHRTARPPAGASRPLLDLPPFRWLGAGIAGFGVVGLALAAGGAGQAPVAAVGGVLPGALLLLASWWGATHQHLTARRRPAAE